MSENQNDSILIPDEVVLTKIFVIRNKKVMIDRDLAELYGLETKQLEEVKQEELESLNSRPKIGHRREQEE